MHALAPDWLCVEPANLSAAQCEWRALAGESRLECLRSKRGEGARGGIAGRTGRREPSESAPQCRGADGARPVRPDRVSPGGGAHLSAGLSVHAVGCRFRGRSGAFAASGRHRRFADDRRFAHRPSQEDPRHHAGFERADARAGARLGGGGLSAWRGCGRTGDGGVSRADGVLPGHRPSHHELAARQGDSAAPARHRQRRAQLSRRAEFGGGLLCSRAPM